MSAASLCRVLMAIASAALLCTPVYAASTIVVPRDFPNIQAAVDAAAPGDTINLNRGTYTEQIVIGKDLNLHGAGATSTIIKSPATLAPFAVNLRNGRPWIAVMRVGHGAHVRVSGLTISGPVPCGTVIGITAVQAATLEFTDGSVKDIHPDTPTCEGARHVGLQLGAPPWVQIEGELGSTANGRVAGVTVDSYLSEGIEVTGPPDGPPSRVKLADNVIDAGSPQFETEQFGIVIFLAAAVDVTGNRILGGVCNFDGCGADPISEFQAMGILVEVGGSGTIADNHVSGSDVGIYQYASPNCCLISGNTLTDNRFFGIVIQDGDGSTNDNKISGGQVGVGVVADAVNTVGVLHQDQIKKTSIEAVEEIECCGFTATATVKDH